MSQCDFKTSFKVGDWTADRSLNLLDCGDRSIRIEPRAMDVLAYFATRPGEVVSINELIEAVWHSNVSDGAVYRVINQLRGILEMSGSEQCYIRTVPKRGYRLIADVESHAPHVGAMHEIPLTTIQDAPRNSRKFGYFLAASVVLAIVGLTFIPRAADDSQALTASGAIPASGSTVIDPASIAVLPFENLSPDPQNAFFAAGIHGSLLNELAKISAITVISRASVLRYVDGSTPVSRIAEELNVARIMKGSVQYVDDQIQIAVQLIDPETGAQLCSEIYNRGFADIFAIQSEIAIRIATALEARFTAAEQQRIETPPTESPDAFAAYLKAMAVVNEGINGPRVGNRMVVQGFLDEALELDPEFAWAHAWKAEVYLNSARLDPVPEENRLEHRFEMERQAAIHSAIALELDPTIGFVHLIRADIHFLNDRPEQSRFEQEQALRLAPNDPIILRSVAFNSLRNPERIAEIVEIQKHVAELEPNFSESYAHLGWYLLAAKRPAEAKEAFEKCLFIDPVASGCTRELAQAEFVLGNYEAAYDALKRAEQLSSSSPATPAIVTVGYGLLQKMEDARRTIEKVSASAHDQYVDPGTWALACLGVGDYDAALAQIDAVIQNQALPRRDQLPMRFVRDIVYNTWSHPTLEEPSFVEAREKLRAGW